MNAGCEENELSVHNGRWSTRSGPCSDSSPKLSKVYNSLAITNGQWAIIKPLLAILCFFVLASILASCSGTSVDNGSGPSVPGSGSAPALTLFGVYPNPFKQKAVIAYEITGGDAERIDISLYNASGEQMRSYTFPSNDSLTISSFHSSSYAFSMGYSEFELNNATAGNLANGVYYYRISIHKGSDVITNTGTCLKVE